MKTFIAAMFFAALAGLARAEISLPNEKADQRSWQAMKDFFAEVLK